MQNPLIHIIILAAGSSSRLGQAKQLLQIDDQPLLRRCALEMLKAAAVTVVLGSDAQRIAAVVDGLAVNVVVNPRWPGGMGTSIKAGVTSVLATTAPPAAIVLLPCDQPGVNAASIQQLITAFETTGKAICAARYADSSGTPVLFSHTLFTDLLSLDDDQGGKALLRQHPADTCLVNMPEAAFDIDTPEEARRLTDRSGA